MNNLFNPKFPGRILFYQCDYIVNIIRIIRKRILRAKNNNALEFINTRTYLLLDIRPEIEILGDRIRSFENF